MDGCPCGSGRDFKDCCDRYHRGEVPAPTAEALMRSRYSAFARGRAEYLQETTDPQTRQKFDFRANEAWMKSAVFTKLEILAASEEGTKGFVEFKAHFRTGEADHVHHEKSRFRRQDGRWYYREGKTSWSP